MELKALREYFCALVELLSVPIDRQASAFITFSRTLKKTRGGNYTLARVAAFNLENIKAVKLFDLYELFLKGRKNNIHSRARAFQSMQAALHMIEVIKENFEKEFTAFIESALKFEQQWKNAMIAYRESYDELWSGIAARGTALNVVDPFLIELQALHAEWVRVLDHSRMHVAIDSFVHPLRKLCLKHPSGEKMTTFLKHAMDCIDAYNNYDYIHTPYRRTFLLYARKLLSSKRDLQHALQGLL
jgi:hypothetical protein